MFNVHACMEIHRKMWFQAVVRIRGFFFFFLELEVLYINLGRLPRWLSGKESTCKAGDAGDLGLIPGSGRSLEKGMATHSSILVWRASWTEEPGGLQCMGVAKSRTWMKPQQSTRVRARAHTHTHTHHLRRGRGDGKRHLWENNWLFWKSP